MAKQRVLIADDEESYRFILNNQLTEAGYTVFVAADGDEAIKTLKAEKIDVALVDINMPKIGGLGVMKFIKEQRLKTQVIVLTGYADLRVAMEAKENGAVDFINKPFTLSDVLSSIKQAIK